MLNDLVLYLPMVMSTLYTDDIMLLFRGTQKDLQYSHRIIGVISNLFAGNNRFLNSYKSVFTQFRQKKDPENTSLEALEIRESSSVKILGLTVDGSLSWDSISCTVS